MTRNMEISSMPVFEEQASCWKFETTANSIFAEKKNYISPLTKRYRLLKRPQHFVLSTDCLVTRIWRELTFSTIVSNVELFLQVKEIASD